MVGVPEKVQSQSEKNLSPKRLRHFVQPTPFAGQAVSRPLIHFRYYMDC
jgi:hypothetical protein